MSNAEILKIIADTAQYTEFSEEQMTFYLQVIERMNPLLLANMLVIAYHAGRRDAHQIHINEDSERLRWQQSIIELRIAFARRES